LEFFNSYFVAFRSWIQHSIKLDDELYNSSKIHAKAEHRTIAGQVSYWAKLGKTALENPDLPISMIQEVLIAKELKNQSTDFAFREE